MKLIQKVLISITLVVIVACNGGGGGGNNRSSDLSPNPNPNPNPDPVVVPNPLSSVSIIDLRNEEVLTDSATFEIDILVANPQGNVVEGLTATNFNISVTDGNVSSVEVVGTPNTPVVDTVRGNYSVTMLLDQSDSMETNDPLDIRLSAVKDFANNRMSSGDEIQVIAFAGNANQPRHPEFDLPSQFYDVTGGFVSRVDEASVDYLATRENGGSPVYDAVIHSLGTSGIQNATNNVRVVIVLTDGINDNPTTVENVLDYYTSNGLDIPIYTLGLGSNVNSDELIRLANGTGGVYSLIENANHLESLFGSLAGHLGSLDSTSTTSYNSFYTLRVTVNDKASYDVVSGVVSILLQNETINTPFSVNLVQ